MRIFTYLLFLFLSSLIFSSAAPDKVNSSSTITKPNIVFIFADDWGWGDLSCHGHPYVKTPNIDRLAKEGTDFHNFTVASGVCSPSRAAIITGHFPARYAIDGHFAWVPQNAKRGMPDWLTTDAPSLPRILKSAGYRTAHYGKWHLSNNMIPDAPSPLAYGYDHYGAFNCSGIQMPYDHDVDNAIRFIKDSHEKKTPFFINLWMHEPHTPFHVVPKYRQMFPDLDKPETETDSIYAATLAYADHRIGELLKTLDDLKLTENTLVIFSSDNGPARSTHRTKPGEKLRLMYDSATGAGFDVEAAKGITAGRKGYKASLFQGGVNVPFIVRWPGKVAAGVKNTSVRMSAVDLLPTFVEIAGAKLPKDYKPDGVSQKKTLMGEKAPSRTSPLFWKSMSRYPNKSRPFHWASYAIMDGKYKLVTADKFQHTELYDIDKDPLEKEDLSKTKPDVTKLLIQKIENWKKTLPSKPHPNTSSKLRKEIK